MAEQETIFQRPKTVADAMLSNMAFYLSTATKIVAEPGRRAHENLQGYRQMEMRRVVEMLGLRAKKIRTPLFRRTYYRPRSV